MPIIWNKPALANRKKRLEKAQTVIDKECIKKMHPYTPVAQPWFANHGKLRRSVQNPEPGKIIYTARFSRSDYYAFVDHLHHGGNPKAKRKWFEYMKSKHHHEIGRKAAKELGAKYLK